jgi:hypothetical protein
VPVLDPGSPLGLDDLLLSLTHTEWIATSDFTYTDSAGGITGISSVGRTYSNKLFLTRWLQR